MRVIIIDDEEPSLNLMNFMIGKNDYLEVVGAYTSARSALEQLPKLQPDAVFTDIEMPEMSGMELAKAIRCRDQNIQIVFVTAYEKYAVDAFAVDAANYLLKPITKEGLSVTVNRLLKNFQNRKHSGLSPKNRIAVLGGIDVYASEESTPVKWPTAKTKELFACFICHPGKEMDKWRLCDLLWPESPPEKALHSLHSSVNRVKTALKNVGIENILVYNEGSYRIDTREFSCDAWELEQYLESNPMVNEGNITSYEKTLDLYRGELFGSEDFAWAVNFKERIEHNYCAGLKKTAAYYLEKKRYAQADTYLKKAIQKNPLDEDAAAMELQLCFFRGDKAGFILFYDDFQRELMKELGIAPRESTKNIFLSLQKKF